MGRSKIAARQAPSSSNTCFEDTFVQLQQFYRKTPSGWKFQKYMFFGEIFKINVRSRHKTNYINTITKNSEEETTSEKSIKAKQKSEMENPKKNCL